LLKEHESVWPTTDKTIPLPDDSNEKRKIVLTIAIEPAMGLCSFSTFMRLKRTIEWMLRFIGNIRKNGKKVIGKISFKELVNARKHYVS